MSKITKAEKYDYPMEMLQQEYFTGGEEICISGSMLAHDYFVSPLGKLIAQLKKKGHNVEACEAEYKAMRKALRQWDRTLEKQTYEIIRLRHSRKN